MAIGSKLQTVNTRSSAVPKSRFRDQSVLPEDDHRLLRCHLEICERSRAPSWTLLAYALQSKIFNTKAVLGPVGRDIVVGGSLVTYSVGGGEHETGLLVHRVQPGVPSGGNILVPSLLGATLIGMRTGQRAPLLCEDGTVNALFILETIPPA